MFLAEPSRTPYDFHFELFGFPVRVTPWHWVASAVLGYGPAFSLGKLPFPHNPGTGMFLLLWMVAVFLSILVHELGHAFAMRRYGSSAAIVLYHFGGLAIPGGTSFDMPWSSSRRMSRENQIVISAAGPGAQIALSLLIILLVEASGYRMAEMVWPIEYFVPESTKPQIPSLPLLALLLFIADCGIQWALLNLLPVFPLDGGQIARELFHIFKVNNPVVQSLNLSLFAAVGVAIWFYTHGNMMTGMLFVSLAVTSYQALQMYRFGGGGRW